MSIDPISLAAVGTGLAVGSKVLGGLSEFSAGRYRAAIADRNRQIAETNAKMSIERSQIEQQEQDEMALVLMGEQQATQGASGLSFGSRSFALTRKATSELARRDALRIRHGGELEARGYRQQGEDFGTEAGMERRGATHALLGSFLEAGGSLASGTAKIRNKSRYSNPKFQSLVGARR